MVSSPEEIALMMIFFSTVIKKGSGDLLDYMMRAFKKFKSETVDRPFQLNYKSKRVDYRFELIIPRLSLKGRKKWLKIEIGDNEEPRGITIFEKRFTNLIEDFLMQQKLDGYNIKLPPKCKHTEFIVKVFSEYTSAKLIDKFINEERTEVSNSYSDFKVELEIENLSNYQITNYPISIESGSSLDDIFTKGYLYIMGTESKRVPKSKIIAHMKYQLEKVLFNSTSEYLAQQLADKRYKDKKEITNHLGVIAPGSRYQVFVDPEIHEVSNMRLVRSDKSTLIYEFEVTLAAKSKTIVSLIGVDFDPLIKELMKEIKDTSDVLSRSKQKRRKQSKK